MAICKIMNALIAKIVCCNALRNCCQDERVIVKTDSPNNSEDAIITNKSKDSNGVQEMHNESEISTQHKKSFKSAANVTAPMVRSTATRSSEFREIDSSNNINEGAMITIYNESKETLATIVVKTKEGTEFKTPQDRVQDSNNESEISTRHKQLCKSAANVIAPMAKSTASSSESKDSNSRYQTANDESTSLQELPKALNKNSRLTSTKIKNLKFAKKNNFQLKKIFQFAKKCK